MDLGDEMEEQQKAYTLLVVPVANGLSEITQLRFVYSSIELLFYKMQGVKAKTIARPLPTNVQEILSNLGRISSHNVNALKNVGRSSLFIYATTIFDAFLSDTTKFLLLLKPEAIGKEKLDFGDLVQAKSKWDAIAKKAQDKAREMAHQTFNARIDFINARFDLKLPISNDLQTALTSNANLRNELIHSQKNFQIGLDDNGKVHVTGSGKSKPLEIDDVNEAVSTYVEIISYIYSGVMLQVLQCPADDKLYLSCKNFLDQAKNP